MNKKETGEGSDESQLDFSTQETIGNKEYLVLL